MRSLFIALLCWATPALAEINEVHIVGNELWVENTSEPTTNFSIVYNTNPPQFPTSVKRLWREIYGVKGGKIVFLRKVEARITPAKVTTEPEKVEWPQ